VKEILWKVNMNVRTMKVLKPLMGKKNFKRINHFMILFLVLN